MVRGVVPRQPAKSGRQEGARKTLARRTVTPARAKQDHRPSTKSKPAKRTGGKAPAGYNPVAPERVRQILKRLDELYPNATCALQHKTAWDLTVATILSAQCTDVRVNLVTPGLFAKYPTAAHFAALKPEELEPDIRSTGFFRNKSKSIVGAAQKVVGEFGGKVPDTMEQLLTIPGVARKTANVVLGTWFKKATGVVVDTHVQRISRRLELTKEEDPQKIEQDLMRVLPQEKWIDFAHQIIWHGRKLCVARNPKCAECSLETLCHAADKTWTTVEIHKAAR